MVLQGGYEGCRLLRATWMQSENDFADSDTQIATHLINLYRAGGWEVADVAFGGDDMPRQKIETR